MIAGIRFSKVGKVYHFDAGSITDLRQGDGVIVETTRGMQLGWVVLFGEDLVTPENEDVKTITRKATPQDLMQRQLWKAKEEAIVGQCCSKVRSMNLSGVKIVDAEFSFDGSRLAIIYNTETDEKVDLNAVRQDVQRIYNNVQIELRQVGPRDMAKCLGGMGACGLETRCCSKFLTDFSSISIRMAKEQGISLTPGEITGMCGRLRCCLYYEYDQYMAVKVDLPKRKQMVNTPVGIGKVIDVAPLREGVIVDLADGGMREFHKSEISVIENPEK
jgi:cell fate regulator YaaT (PSP1 superfamily)